MKSAVWQEFVHHVDLELSGPCMMAIVMQQLSFCDGSQAVLILEPILMLQSPLKRPTTTCTIQHCNCSCLCAQQLHLRDIVWLKVWLASFTCDCNDLFQWIHWPIYLFLPQCWFLQYSFLSHRLWSQLKIFKNRATQNNYFGLCC